jgi:hypothetical protein
MKLFNLDCHISVIADLKKIFTDLGHEVVSWSISGHNFIFDREPSKVDVINQQSWWHLDDAMVDEFYKRYKDELSEFDAFVCTYPLSFAKLYEKFKKPIILHVPIRYEVPFHNNKQKWEDFNEYLRNGIDQGFIIPVANSEYDKKYFEFFVERECKFIPNICEYTNTKWNPTKDQFLYSGRLPVNLDPNKIVNKDNLGRYKWDDLSTFKGIIVMPYTCSTMSIFEHYTANIPLFFPSKKHIMELYQSFGNVILSEITWNRIFSLPPGSLIECDRSNDPNAYNNLEIMDRWIDYSDFYNQDSMPHIVYFDSVEDLLQKLETTNLSEVSEKMSNFNKVKKVNVYEEWNKILSNL